MFVTLNPNNSPYPQDAHAVGPRAKDQEVSMLRIEIQSWNTTATLYCNGNLVLGVETETLRAMAQARHEYNIRIDLSAVEKIDAAGLGLLVELQVWARENHREIAFVELSEAVWNLVILTKLYSTLEISYSGVPDLRRETDFTRNELIA
jgi:anti-anti-sigma factor